MWRIVIVYLCFAGDTTSILKKGEGEPFNSFSLTQSFESSASKERERPRKPFNKYYVQGGYKLKTKRVKIPIAEYLTSLRIQEFRDRLEDFILRTNIFQNFTSRESTYYFMSGFLTQLDKQYIIDSKHEEHTSTSSDHLLIPRLHSKNDDTVIIFQYSGAIDLQELEAEVSSKLTEMLSQNYMNRIINHFPGGRKESKRIKHLLLVSLGICYDEVVVRHKKLKLEGKVDQYTRGLLQHLTNHDMSKLQRSLDAFIVATRLKIQTPENLKKLVEGFLNLHEDYYPMSNAKESIYIPRNRQKNRKNIAFLIRYKIQDGPMNDDMKDDIENEINLKNASYFEQFPTVDTVRTVLLVHKKHGT